MISFLIIIIIILTVILSLYRQMYSLQKADTLYQIPRELLLQLLLIFNY